MLKSDYGRRFLQWRHETFGCDNPATCPGRDQKPTRKLQDRALSHEDLELLMETYETHDG